MIVDVVPGESLEAQGTRSDARAAMRSSEQYTARFKPRASRSSDRLGVEADSDRPGLDIIGIRAEHAGRADSLVSSRPGRSIRHGPRVLALLARANEAAMMVIERETTMWASSRMARFAGDRQLAAGEREGDA